MWLQTSMLKAASEKIECRMSATSHFSDQSRSASSEWDAGIYLNTSFLLGYFTNTKRLLVARSSGQIQVLDGNDGIMPDSGNKPIQVFSSGSCSGD